MSERERRTKLTLEPLEGRVVPSAAVPNAGVTTSALVRGTGYLFLTGTAHGKVHQTPGNPNPGSTITFHGQGRLTSLGVVKVSGSLHSANLLAPMSAGGTVRLSNGRGTVTLSLDRPFATDVSPGDVPDPDVPGSYLFSLVEGTGAFARDLANGRVEVSLSGNFISLTFHGAPNRF